MVPWCSTIRKVNFCMQTTVIRRSILPQATSKFSIFLSRCSSEGGNSSSSPNRREKSGVQTGPNNAHPFVYAPMKWNFDKQLLEKPFIFRVDKKKRKLRKKTANSKAKEKVEDKVLVHREDDNPTVEQAIKIVNSILEEDGSVEYSNSSSKSKEKSIHEWIEDLRKNQAQILGLSDSQLLWRYEVLTKLGVSRIDAIKTAILFPSFLSLNSPNIENMIKLLASYKVDLIKMFQQFPYVFSLNHHDVVKKLEHLGSLGLKKKDVSDLINSNPIIICFGLTEIAKNSLKFATGFPGWKSLAGKSNFIESLFKTSLQTVSVKYNFDDNFATVASFAAELHVPVSEIFKRCPDLFSLDNEQISRTVHFLGDSPFYFDTEDIGNLIQKSPEIFLQLDKEDVRKQINEIYQLMGEDAELHNLLQHSPKVVTESKFVLKRIKLFKRWNFTRKHIGYLMNKFPILFIDNRVVDNLEERLQLMLGQNDLTSADIMVFPICLQMRIILLKSKIGFIRSTKQAVLKNSTLQDIFTAKDEHFAVNICSSTLKTFYSYLKDNFSDADQEWIKKKGKPRASKALSQSN